LTVPTEGLSLVSVPFWAWLAVLGVILAMLAFDLFAHRKAHVIGVKEAAAWSLFWVVLGVAFGLVIYAVWGGEFASQYYAGYVIEKSLAVDNVFVWAIIFSYFAVPREYQHRVLFYGVVGALIFRGIFIAAGSVLIASFAWILYIFGAFLVLTGIKMARSRNEHLDPEKSLTLRLFRRFIPTTDQYEGQRFVVRHGGKLMATPLLAVLVLVEVTDIVFAVDSIPAIFAVTQEPFLVFTANAFAILGLRAMYFLLADLIHRFIYLKLGLSLVLVWVGIKMLLLVDIYKIPTTLSLAVVLAIIAISITASLVKTRGTTAPEFIGQEPHGTSESSSPPPQDVEGPAEGRDISADVATEPDAVVGVAGGSPVQNSTDSTEEEVVR
jgi:tellurite resistance protein TerC